MTFSIIQKSQIESTMRLDAEYFQPQYLEADQALEKFEFVLLDSISEKITQGPNPEFQNEGIICLNGRNIKNNRLEEDNSNYISENEFNKYKNFQIKSRDILITLKGLGSIGKIGYVQRNIDAIFSRDIGLIRISDKNKSAFVFAFLLSKYGNNQIEKSITGSSGQRTLGTSCIKNFKIPIIGYKIISSSVFQSENLFTESNSLYMKAEELLLKELGIDDFKSENKLYSIVNFSDCRKANRIDADYFQPKYQQLIDRLVKNKSALLSELIENVPANFNPMLNPEEDFNYVELSNIDSSLGIISGSSGVLGKEAASRAKRMLQKNDVIVSSVEGSLGKVALTNEDQKGYLASTGFFQLRSKAILPEVLLVMAKSIVFQYQLTQRCAGTILTAVPQDSINNILIPIVSKTTQETIADLVRRSHAARKKSKELLEEAKRKVEEIIEKGGQNNK